MTKESGNLGRTPTPIRKAEVVEPKVVEAVKAEEPQDYQFILTFNDKAQLTDVASPEGMSLELTANHLAVVQLWLAQEIVKKGEKK